MSKNTEWGTVDFKYLIRFIRKYPEIQEQVYDLRSEAGDPKRYFWYYYCN